MASLFAYLGIVIRVIRLKTVFLFSLNRDFDAYIDVSRSHAGTE